MNDLWYGYEDAPYKKSKSKKPILKKSDHKHKYAIGLIRDETYKHWYRCEYCTSCGRIKTVLFFGKELTEKDFNTLPMFEVTDIFKDKFVPLQNKK